LEAIDRIDLNLEGAAAYKTESMDASRIISPAL
jgi:hypothetical protein